MGWAESLPSDRAATATGGCYAAYRSGAGRLPRSEQTSGHWVRSHSGVAERTAMSLDLNKPLALGADFGALAGRTLVFRVSDGAELGSAVHSYPHLVIDDVLPGTEVKLFRTGHGNCRPAQILKEDPAIYAVIDHWAEAADWIVSGSYTRNACTAGCTGIRQDGKYPATVPRRLPGSSRRSAIRIPSCRATSWWCGRRTTSPSGCQIMTCRTGTGISATSRPGSALPARLLPGTCLTRKRWRGSARGSGRPPALWAATSWSRSLASWCLCCQG